MKDDNKILNSALKASENANSKNNETDFTENKKNTEPKEKVQVEDDKIQVNESTIDSKNNDIQSTNNVCNKYESKTPVKEPLCIKKSAYVCGEDEERNTDLPTKENAKSDKNEEAKCDQKNPEDIQSADEDNNKTSISTNGTNGAEKCDDSSSKDENGMSLICFVNYLS